MSLATLKAHNVFLRPKQICVPPQELSKNMWHGTDMHVIQCDSIFLMVGSQIDTLIPDLSFGHNVCCKHSNGSCKTILNIYISKAFQCYNEIFNLMSFDPSNRSLKIRESIETPIPKSI